MKYRKFGNEDWLVSALGFGCMRLPTTDRKRMSKNVNEDEAIKMIRYAIDSGVNFIDTAYLYHDGQSEVVVGKALREGYREKVRLVTKSPLSLIKKADDFDRYLDEQLERLQVKQVDYYLLHGLNTNYWRETVLPLKLLDRAEKAMQKALIGKIGFSFHDHYDRFIEIVNYYDSWAMCLLQYNYLDVQTQAGTRGVRYAAARGIPVAVMEPLLGGLLARPPQPVIEILEKAIPGRPPYEWALQWLWNQPEVSVVLSGMTTFGHLENNLRAAEKSGAYSMPAAEVELLETKVLRQFRDLNPIPCTRCYYCTPCPHGVNIPHNLTIYNNGYAYNRLEAFRSIYGQFGKSAEECTGCGECEEKCPQGIPVSRWMPQIHKVMGLGEPYPANLSFNGKK